MTLTSCSDSDDNNGGKEAVNPATDDDGYTIEVEILKEIDYKDTCFSKAAHRLALAELEKIVEFQKKGECLDQLPEGTTAYQKRYWENKYKIRSQKEESC